MEVIGFVFGLSGLSFALITMEKLSVLRKEFDELKNNLADSGIIITAKSESPDK